MGKSGLPFVLEELRMRPTGAWFPALEAMADVTDETNPAASAKNIDEAIIAWIKWSESG